MVAATRSRSVWLEAADEISDWHAESLREPDERDEARVASPSLEAIYLGWVQASGQAESFLRQLRLSARPAQVRAEDSARIILGGVRGHGWHPVSP